MRDEWGNSMLRMAMVVEDRKPGAVELVLTIAQSILTDIQVKIGRMVSDFRCVTFLHMTVVIRIADPPATPNMLRPQTRLYLVAEVVMHVGYS